MQRVKTFLHRVHNFLTPPERRVGDGVGHWFHERMTFITGRSREWIVQRVAVAVANATYDAALQLASASRGPDATAFQAVHLTPTHSTCTYAGSPDSTPTPTP